MFWEDIEPVMTDRLERAVARSYEVFEKYRLNGTIAYCDCNVCMTAGDATKLSSLPLNEISSTLLGEYTNSAHGYDTETIEPQFKHFLPRYLDLIAQCDPPSSIGLETCLSRLGCAAFRKTWPSGETEIIEEFFDAFIEASLNQLLLLEWPVGLRLEFDIDDVLCMVVIAGGDLERVLGVFDGAADPEAAVHMASLRSNIQHAKGGPRYSNPFLDDHPEAAQRIAEWLGRETVTERIMGAADLLDDANYDDVLAMGL